MRRRRRRGPRRRPERRGRRRWRRLSATLTEAADSEALSDGEEGVEVRLLHLDLTIIHKVQDVAQVGRSDVAQNHHRIGSRVRPRRSGGGALEKRSVYSKSHHQHLRDGRKLMTPCFTKSEANNQSTTITVPRASMCSGNGIRVDYSARMFDPGSMNTASLEAICCLEVSQKFMRKT